MVYTVDGENYTRRTKIPVTGAGSGAQTDFQIKLATTWAAAMQADFDDVRFTKADMQTLIDAWLESKVDSTSADIWVEFLTTPADGVEKTEAYMYFGNAGASSDWDIENTFLLGDDFEDGTLDTTTRWSLDNQGAGAKTNTEANGELQLAVQNAQIGAAAIKSQQTFTDNIVIEYKRKCDSGTYIGVSIGSGNHVAKNGGTSEWWLSCLQSGYCFHVQNNYDYHIIREMPASGGSSNLVLDGSTSKSESSYTNQKIILSDEGSNNIRWYYEDALLIQATDATFLSNEKNIMFVQGEYSSGAGGNQYLDNIRVRKYAANPPTAAFGIEEHQRRTPMMM